VQQDVRDWVDKVGVYLNLSPDDVSHLRGQVKRHAVHRGISTSHLLIQLRPQGTDSTLFLVRAWCAIDYTGDKPYEGIESIDFSEGEERRCTISDLPMLLGDLIDEAYEYLWGTDDDLSIALFVPRALLNHTIDHWEIPDPVNMPMRIGTRYTVSLRSHERLSPRYIKQVWRNWKRSWDQLRAPPSTNGVTPIRFCDPENAEHAALRARLIREEIACLLLTFAPPISPKQPDVFSAILGVGTPVALWPRQCMLTPADMQQELDTLTQQKPISYLPQAVRVHKEITSPTP
jgi:hypothetical protein